MPTEPLNFPQMGVGLQGGLQLVRDPASGHLLLIHAAGNIPPVSIVLGRETCLPLRYPDLKLEGN